MSQTKLNKFGFYICHATGECRCEIQRLDKDFFQQCELLVLQGLISIQECNCDDSQMDICRENYFLENNE